MADGNDMEFINQKIFPFLSNQLGLEWARFIRMLPGWGENRAHVLIDRAKEEQMSVPDRIFACLEAWQKECPQEVSVQSILFALECQSVNRSDLKEKVEHLDFVDSELL